MKNVIILILIVVSISFSQQIKPTFEITCEFENGIARVKSGNLWGYIDTTGSFVIKPIYKAVSRFRNEKALVVQPDDIKILINKKGDHLEIFNDKPEIKANYILELPEPKGEKNFESYVNHFLTDSNTVEYDFYNCMEGESSAGKSIRMLKYGIVNKNNYGYDDSYRRYFIPNYSIEKAVSLLEILTKGQDYQISQNGPIINFMSKKNWITSYHIQNISTNVISIAVNTSI